MAEHDRMGDTLGPDITLFRAKVSERNLIVRIDLADPLGDNLMINVDVDADADLQTGSRRLPCNTATVGADYRISFISHRGAHVFRSDRSGCVAPMSTSPVASAETRVAASFVVVAVPLADLPGRSGQTMTLLASAQVARGPGQIDFCPGQASDPLVVSY